MPTLTMSGTIAFPLADESTPPSRTFSFTLNYTQKVTRDFNIVGAQADVDLMDAITDAKFAFVECLVGDGVLEVEGAAAGVPIEAGQGFQCWANPSGGLTTFTVTTTADATFRCYVFS